MYDLKPEYGSKTTPTKRAEELISFHALAASFVKINGLPSRSISTTTKSLKAA